MSTVFLRRLSRWQAESQREEIADLYAGGHQEAPGARPLGREEFLARLTDHDVQQPGFDMVLANDPGPAGCAYGYRADRGGPWWEGFRDVPTEIEEFTGSRQVFVVAVLLVLPRVRRQGIGTRLLDQALSRAGAPSAVTLVDPGNAAARSACQSWGWAKAGELTRRGGDAPQEAWVRRLDRCSADAR